MSHIITSSSSKTEFTALTLWLNREKEAYPHLKKRQIVSVENVPTPTMPGHYSSDPSVHFSSERKRKSLGSEMGLYEAMLKEEEEEEEEEEGESGFESFEASGILPLSPDVSVEQEDHSQQIIIVEMEEELEEELEEVQYEEEEEENVREEEEGIFSTYTQEDFGHFLDPVEEVTEEPTMIEWEEESSSSSTTTIHTPLSQRLQISFGQSELHEWARMHGLGTPSSVAPSPAAAASRFGWAEVIAQTRMQEAENDKRLKSVTIFSPFSPAKAMGLKSDYWILSPTKPTLSKSVLLSRQSNQLFLKEKEADNSNDSGWIDVQPIDEKHVSDYKREGNSTFRRKTKWAAIIPDRFASLRSRSSRP